jgi:hypothetical protein
MRTKLSGFAVALVGFVASCAVDPAVDTATTDQDVLGQLKSCFVNLGQPDPSVPLSRRFDSSCSTPTPGSFIWFRSWDFGDGTGSFTGGTLTDHTFPFTNSCYKVQLTVWDANGQSDTSFQNVQFCTVGPCIVVCPP